tara:strand:+ start:898 stop:1011 length:114 start_codon:yes stop_codon:yes gene_type:complete
VGNIKEIKKTIEQNVVGRMDFLPVKRIFIIGLNPLPG